MRADNPMVVDCDRCPVRGSRCDDCIVTALASLPVVVLSDGELPLDAGERRAVDRFLRAGLLSADVAGTLVARREPFTATSPQERAVG